MDVSVVPVLVVLLVLISASLFDLRKREVPDIHWWIIGIVGVVSMIAFNELGPMQWLMVAGTVLILLDMLVDVDFNATITVIKYAAITALFAVPVILSHDDPLTQQFAVIPVCYAIFYLLYLTGVLKGGADAKCLIAMGIAFQRYPAIVDTLIPVPEKVELIIAYPIALLFHAALFSLATIVYVTAVKIRNSEPLGIKSVSVYRMPLAKAKNSHVWLKEDIVDGRITDVPEADGEAYGRLEKYGVKTVKVSVIIPFIVPITAAYVFMLTVGNILFIPFM